MTSGNFTSFPTASIYVERDERQRRELKDIESLAASIARVGLINPIVVERDGKLRAGERRFTAVQQLGWTHVSVQFTDEVDEAELQLIELEENIKRAQLPWPDECAAVARYHAMLQAKEGKWTIEQTAEALGMSRQVVGDKLAVHKEIEAGNERVINAPKMSVARGVVARTREREQSSAVSAILAAAAVPGAIKKPERVAPLIHADFHEWINSYRGERFNFLHCDFPYGVNADKHDQGQAAAQGGYADGFGVYQDLLNGLKGAMRGIVSESAHLMFWFSMDYYDFTLSALTDMGWTVNPFPLVWFKNDNTGILPDPNRGPRRVYETAFLGARGDRKLTARGATGNAIAWPGRDKSIHMSEKPVGMLKHFMGMVVDEHSRVLDPTCGSGNALKAAQQLGANAVLGIERDAEFYARAKAAYFGLPAGSDEDAASTKGS